MNRLLLDIVQDGQIPIYAAPTRGMRYYTHTEELVWDPRRATDKILISVGVDHRLDSIRKFLDTELLRDEGTLIFAIRYVEALTMAFQNTPTLFVLGGMAFVPGDNTLGVPLENGDPWPIVRQFIHTAYRIQRGGLSLTRRTQSLTTQCSATWRGAQRWMLASNGRRQGTRPWLF